MAIEILKTIAAVIAAAAAVWGIYVYFSNSRLRRAEWIASMYEKFYEQAEPKDIREALDCGGSNSANISRFINEEPREFTDYLNFFECGCSRKVAATDQTRNRRSFLLLPRLPRAYPCGAKIYRGHRI